MSLNSTNSSNGKRCEFVFGIDEVGRGAFAGPLILAAVCLKPDSKIQTDFKDSKKLSAKQRQAAAAGVRPHLFHLEYETVTVEEIDRLGVGKAEENGLRRMMLRLCRSFANPFFRIDYFTVKDFPGIRQEGIVKGDEKVYQIALASIFAKLKRDSLMKELSAGFPDYGWDTNVGYGTGKHREAIRTKGLTPHHRLSFCQNCIIIG